MFYRTNAEKVEALICPEDSEPEKVTWHLEGQEHEAVSHKKVSSADKAATPQELLKKAQ